MKYYVSYWSVDDDLKRGNKNTIHNFVAPSGEKCTVASKLRRVDCETLEKIKTLISNYAESEG